MNKLTYNPVLTNIDQLDMLALVDLLEKHTLEFMAMIKEGATEEKYDACKNCVEVLAIEIKSRRNRFQPTTRNLPG